jgi:hypothetical protein
LTSAYAIPTPARVAAIRTTGASFDKATLGKIAFAVGPAMVAVAIGQPAAGAVYLLTVLFVCLVYHFITRTPQAASAVVIGTLPVWMLLRNYFYYSSVELVLALCVFAWMEGGMSDFKAVWKDRLVQGMFAMFAIYWALAFLLTGDYSSEMRVFELFFSALNVYLLGKHRRWLGTAFFGVAVSVVAIGFGLLPYGDRLGMAEVGGSRLGNPISFGIPAALVLLLSLADGGRWLMLRERPKFRLALQTVVGVLLVLSTSRGSWLVLIFGAGIILMTDRSQRKSLLTSIAVLAVFISRRRFHPRSPGRSGPPAAPNSGRPYLR